MEKKNNKGLIITVVILVLLVIGLGSYIVYDKVLNKEVQEPVKEATVNNDGISEDLAISLGKKLYIEARDVAYNLCALPHNTDICYYQKNGIMMEDNTCQSQTDELYYNVNYDLYKDIFTQNGLNQYEKFMSSKGNFLISNNKYYVYMNLGDCYQGLDKDATKISISNMSENKIVYDINEHYCDFDENYEDCITNNGKFGTNIDTTITIIKENNDWKIEEYNDTYNKYLEK